jgi:predicted flap endonuclease-1-like 5' DNA nuclease
MFNTDITKNYQLLDATFEILIMLAGTFLLGALFCWAMGKLRGNKNNRKAPYLRKTVDHQNGFRQPVQQARVTYPDEPHSNDPTDTGVAIVHSEIPSTSSPAIKLSTETTDNTEMYEKSTKNRAVITKKPPPTKSAIIKLPSESVATTDTRQNTTAIVDDFKKIKGIGLKTENTLHTAGIKTYADLRASSYEALKEILSSANLSIRLHDPETWPYQADLAYNAKWKKLKQYQDFLIGGEKRIPINESI